MNLEILMRKAPMEILKNINGINHQSSIAKKCDVTFNHTCKTLMRFQEGGLITMVIGKQNRKTPFLTTKGKAIQDYICMMETECKL